MISVDDHILEPASIWQDRLPAQYLEAGPQVVVKDGTGELDAIFDVHVRAAWMLAEAVWPGMVERNYGRIVLTTSSAGLYGDGTGPGPNPKQAYAMAKAAVVGLTKALAVRGRPANIVVNAVSPSAFTRLVGLNKGIINPRPGAPLPDAAIEFSRANSPTHLVAAGALFMMHENCPVTGKIFNVGTGRVGEVFVGVTRGYVSPHGELVPEDVLDHFDEVRDISESNVPVDIGAHGSWVRSVLAERANRAARDASELHKGAADGTGCRARATGAAAVPDDRVGRAHGGGGYPAPRGGHREHLLLGAPPGSGEGGGPERGRDRRHQGR
jgi:hypothetical protein